MLCRQAKGFVIAVAFLTLAALPASARDADPHRLYENHCAGCHAGHAGDFVPGALVEKDGAVWGRTSGRGLAEILAGGHGRVDRTDVAALTDHLTAVLQSGSLFRDRCRVCHDRAVVLARRSLIVRDGRIVGRYTGRDIAKFLRGHGRLHEDEIPTILRMLRRQLDTAPR